MKKSLTAWYPIQSQSNNGLKYISHYNVPFPICLLACAVLPSYRGWPLIGRSPSTPFFKIKSYLIEDITYIELALLTNYNTIHPCSFELFHPHDNPISKKRSLSYNELPKFICLLLPFYSISYYSYPRCVAMSYKHVFRLIQFILYTIWFN